jgi:DNA repair exonuclease SbcCD ATPase subunit
MENHTTYDKVKALRSDGGKPISEISFKKAAFGGYDCKEVVEHIKNLKNNMLLSERAYNEKLEEYSLSSSMYTQEREKLIKKTKENEEEIERLKAANAESIERGKIFAESVQKENMELKELVVSLHRQIEDSEQSEKTIREMEEIARENKELGDQICELAEEKEKLRSQNTAAAAELDRVSKYNEKLTGEIAELKKNQAKLKTAKRNFAMDINMRVYEYQQSHQLAIESISGSICDISKVLSIMKAEMAELSEKSKTDLKAEDSGSNVEYFSRETLCTG